MKKQPSAAVETMPVLIPLAYLPPKEREKRRGEAARYRGLGKSLFVKDVMPFVVYGGGTARRIHNRKAPP